MRQLAVAQRAKRHGATTIAVPPEGHALLEHLGPGIRGLVLPELQPHDEAAWILDRFGRVPVYIVDSYCLPASYYERLSSKGHCIAFDDGDRSLPASLTVRPRPGESSNDTILEGCAYIPIREGFTSRSGSNEARRLVVCFGASDPTGATATMLARLPVEALDSWRLTIVRGPLAANDDLGLQRLTDGGWSIDVVHSPDMPTLLSSADAAVVAAGSIVWELAAVGVPTAAFSVVDNQDQNARWLADHGCVAGGWRLGTQPVAESADLIAFLTNAQWRHSLADALSQQVDGRGAERVVNAALALTTKEAG